MAWYDVLLAARAIGSEAEKKDGKTYRAAVPFTAAQLAEEAGFKATERSGARDIAAGWISKLVRWGYVKRVGKDESAGGRPVVRYELTTWGLKFRPAGAKAHRRAAANEGD